MQRCSQYFEKNFSLEFIVRSISVYGEFRISRFTVITHKKTHYHFKFIRLIYSLCKYNPINHLLRRIKSFLVNRLDDHLSSLLRSAKSEKSFDLLRNLGRSKNRVINIWNCSMYLNKTNTNGLFYQCVAYASTFYWEKKKNDAYERGGQTLGENIKPNLALLIRS